MKKKGAILLTRATVDTTTVNATEKTFDVVFATETPVYRSAYWADESFFEVLVCAKSNIRSERLDNGVVPFIDNHSAYTITNQYGSVTAWNIKGGECRATIQYSDQDSKADLWKDIVSGKIKGISVGYRVWKYEVVRDKDPKKTPTYRAIDWEPVEISMAVVPQDYMSSIRAEGGQNENDIEFINLKRSEMTPEEIEAARAEAVTNEQKRSLDIRLAVRAAGMPESFADELTGRSDGGKPLTLDGARAAITAAALRQAQDDTEAQGEAPGADVTRALDDEHVRIDAIRSACIVAGLPDEFANALVKRKVGKNFISVDAAKAAIVDKMAELDRNIGGPGEPGGASARGDERTHILNAMVEGMMHRAQPGSVERFYELDTETKGRKMDVKAHDFKHMSFIDVSRAVLKMNGVAGVEGMSKTEIAKRALDTTDLPDLFTTNVKRFLRMYYEPVVPEWMGYSRHVPADDFRLKTGVKFDTAVTFEELDEEGEYKESNMMSDEKATIQLQTYARKFSVTRKTIINDDLGVLTDIPRAIGIGAKQFQSKKVWAMITGNVNTPDGNALFSSTHGNLATGKNASAIVDSALSAGRTAMRRQKSPAGNELDINPKFLLVPPELQTQAEKLLRLIYPTTTAAVNLWGSLVPDTNVYLSDPLAWYLIAAPETTTVDGMVHSYLTGQEGLFTESFIDKATDKLVIKSRLDFQCAMWGYAGWYKNTGAAAAND